MEKGAEFSPDRKYRYSLWRRWNIDLSYVMFIGLNPSTADEIEDDPTIKRCVGFAKRWGYGGMDMTNLFAFRSSKPQIMKGTPSPIGPENDKWLVRISQKAEIVVAAWGNHGNFMARDEEILKLIWRPIYHLELTQRGNPRHPLFLPNNIRPKIWKWRS